MASAIDASAIRGQGSPVLSDDCGVSENHGVDVPESIVNVAVAQRVNGFLETLSDGELIQVRVPPQQEGAEQELKPFWVACRVHTLFGTAQRPTVHAVVRHPDALDKWVPLKEVDNVEGPVLDVDLTNVLIQYDDEFRDSRHNQYLVDRLDVGVEVAVSLESDAVLVVDTSRHGGLDHVRIPLEMEPHHNGNGHVGWWPGHVQRCHTILGTHKVFEVHIQDEFRDENTPEMASFLWRLRKDAAAVHQLITDGEKRAHGVVCFDFKARPGVSGRDRVKFLLGLVSRTFGWAPSDTLVASGKLEASEAWCVLQAPPESGRALRDLLSTEATWCSVESTTQCSLRWAIRSRDPRDTSSLISPGISYAHTATALRSDQPSQPLSVFLTQTARAPWVLNRENIDTLLGENSHSLDGCSFHDPMEPGAHQHKFIASYLPEPRELVVSTQKFDSGLTMNPSRLSGKRIWPLRVPTTTPFCVDQHSTHFATCSVCMEFHERSSFQEFCFNSVEVSGDEEEPIMQFPRHPSLLCRACLQTHCEVALRSGQLYVPCPAIGCERSLQTLELKQVVSPDVFSKLIRDLRDVELHGSRAFASSADIPDLDLRECPSCATAIERSEGCSSMQCFRCGEDFDWDASSAVRPKRNKSENSDASEAMTEGQSPQEAPQEVPENSTTLLLGTKQPLNTVWHSLGRVFSLLPLFVALGLALWSAQVSPEGKALEYSVQLTPLTQGLWDKFVGHEVTNGTCAMFPWPTHDERYCHLSDEVAAVEPFHNCTALPWPNKLEKYCGHKDVLEIARGLKWCCDWLEAVFSFGLAAGTTLILALLSPLADEPDLEEKAAARVKHGVAPLLLVGVGLLWSSYSDVVWEFGPAALVTGLDFLFYHFVNCVKFFMFDHAGDTMRVILVFLFTTFWFEHFTLFYWIDSSLKHEKIDPLSLCRALTGTSSLFWLGFSSIAATFFALTDTVLLFINWFSGSSGQTVRAALSRRSQWLWDNRIEPYLLPSEHTLALKHLVTAARNRAENSRFSYLYNQSWNALNSIYTTKLADGVLEDLYDFGKEVVDPRFEYDGLFFATAFLLWFRLRSLAILTVASAISIHLFRVFPTHSREISNDI